MANSVANSGATPQWLRSGTGGEERESKQAIPSRSLAVGDEGLSDDWREMSHPPLRSPML